MPAADILIHCGDVCMMDNRALIRDFNAWLGQQAYGIRIVVPGNHDDPVIEDPELLSNATVLLNDGIRIDGLHIWGAGWSWPPERRNREWAMIPDSVDVLVTHVPPYGTLDWAPVGNPCGLVDLREAVKRIRPRLHVFGHIHLARGMVTIGDTLFVNAANVSPDGEVEGRPPIVVRIGRV